MGTYICASFSKAFCPNYQHYFVVLEYPEMTNSKTRIDLRTVPRQATFGVRGPPMGHLSTFMKQQLATR